MARSRLEKIGTIFDRVSALLKSNAMKPEDRPIWYDVYEAFPPKLEPRFDRPAPDIPIKNIFYHEDKIRAKFQRSYKMLGSINLSNQQTQTVTQQFLTIYNNLRQENDLSEDEIYDRAIEQLNNERAVRRQDAVEKESSILSSFKEASGKARAKEITTDIKDIFKE